jgi:CubicO group peptidase (beta-lactamase class C family)
MIRARLAIAFLAETILVGSLAMATCGAARGHAAAASPAAVARMDQIVESYVKSGQFMGTVLVARGNDILINKGYGYADLEWKISNVPEAKFRPGSITKQFTAAAILLLQERGKLDVHDAVKKYIPNAPAAWDKITIFNLLTHTSGIPNFTSFPNYRSIEPFSQSPDDLIALFRDKPLDFQPGEKWSYSNSGYIVLGYLIGKISGENYAEFVQKNIFDPLGMRDSGYGSNATIIPDFASGYTPGPKGLVNAGYVNMSVPFSAGALYSTTGDLFRWEQGLFGGKLLSAESLKEMTTPFKSDYAFGLMVRSVQGRKMIDHGGGIEGFNTELAYYPDDRLTVVVLGNVNGGAPGEIGRDLGTVAEGGRVVLASERKEVHVDPQVLEGYVGNYQLTPNFSIAITRDGDHLYEQATSQPKFEIYPEREKEFFLKVADAQIEFVTNSQGKATALILHQNGIDQRGPRVVGAPAPPKEAAVVHVDPKILNGYVGTYQLVPGFDITITRDGDHLYEQATNQPKLEIFPSSEKEFFLKVVDAQITFVTDAQGRVTELVLHQNGMDHTGKRIN